VLSLTVMAAMVMLVIVLASFLQVEGRLAQSHSGYLRARFNALASARIAVGQLQQLAGPDQRVTMRADMYADNDKIVGGTNADTIQPLRGQLDRANNNAPIGGKLSHQKRYLTGVWSTGGADATRVRDWDVSNPADSRLFLGWLASPFDQSADPELSGTPPNLVPNNTYFTNSGNFRVVTPGVRAAEAQALIDDLGNEIDADPTKLVPLVSSGTLDLPAGLTGLMRNYRGAIDARPQPMPGPTYPDTTAFGANGRYAFWIGDEGVKAKVNLPDHYASTGAGTWLSADEWDKGFAASANQRNSIAAIGASGAVIREGVNAKGNLPAGFNFDAWRAGDINAAAGNPNAYRLAKAVGIAGLAAWANERGGAAAGQAMTDAAKVLWHDVTTYSFSTLTDTYNGGVKIDLSTAFELPYAMYRGIETYPGQKDTTIQLPGLTAAEKLKQSRQSLFHGAPNAHLQTTALGSGGLAVDLDYNRPNLVDKLGSASDLLRASPRASEWAPRYLSSMLGNSYTLLRTRNNNETPERMGFVYEAPLRSAFFDDYALGAGNISRILANTEQSPSAITTSWVATGSGVTIPGLTSRVNVMPWPELGVNNVENLLGRVVRGPTWDLYRNYYRMYKREVEEAGKSSGALRGQAAVASFDKDNPNELAVVARGVEPLTYASGNRNRPLQRGLSNTGSGAGSSPRNYAPPPDNFYALGGAPSDQRYFYRNNLSTPSDAPSFQAEQRLRYPNILPHMYGGVASGIPLTGAVHIANFDRMGIAAPRPAGTDAYFDTPRETTTRTWPTSMSLAPSIVRFSMVFAGVFDEAQTIDELGNISRGTIGVTVDPVVVVHNPYDVAIEFEGLAMVTSGDSLPYIFDVRLESWIVRDTHWQYFDPIPDSPRTIFQTEPLPRDLTPGSVWSGELRVRDLTIGEVALGDGAMENRSVSFRLVNPGSKFRLEPGEVRTITTKHMGGDYNSNRTNNTTITTNDFGYDLGSKAVYKMTPFYNVRYRSGNDISTQFNDKPIPSAWNHLPTQLDARLWTWGFKRFRTPGDGKQYAEPLPTGANQAPAHGFFGNYCYNNSGGGVPNPADLQDALELWREVKNQRRIRDGLPLWRGDARTLKDTLDNPPNGNLKPKRLSFVVRNSGWLQYDNRIVGEEGTFGQTGFVFPRLRNGTTAVGGHQRWNFYLLNNKSIDGQDLNPKRRWFGSPFTGNPGFDAGTQQVSNYQSEGSQTAPGQHLVDESLLLNFQALTAGWPLYGNDNGHWNNIIQYEENWKAFAGLPARSPDYRIATGRNTNSYTGRQWRGDADLFGTEVSFGPESGDPEFGRPEITSGRALTLNGRVKGDISHEMGDTKQYFFISDFLLRSAEMTGRTRSIWYPEQATDAAFKFLAGGILRTPPDVYHAPMSPYFLSVRAQQAHLYGYDGKAHTPIGWVLSQRRLTEEPEFPVGGTNNRNAYWGGSIEPATTQRVDTVLFPIPRRPLLSLAQLGSAGIAQVNTDPDFTVGSSFANPGIMDLTKVTDWPGPKKESGDDKAIPENGWVGIHSGTRIIRNYANVRTDHAFAANLALWDTYFFSGLNLPANSYSLPGKKNSFPGGPDLPTDSAVLSLQSTSLRRASGNDPGFDASSFRDIKAALEAGYNPLANKRVVFQPDTKTAVGNNTFPGATDFPHPTYLSRNSLYDGGFNVNSTSKSAWKAVLAGMRGQTLPDGSTAGGTVLTRFARSFRSATGNNNAWNNYRELSDPEIDDLAAQVVKEVRDRGPFMSLGDFVNRRLLNTPHGLKGPLQAAIDRSGINKAAIESSAGVLAAGVFPAPPQLNLSTDFTDPLGARTGNFTDKNGDGPGVYGVLKKATNPTAKRFPNIASMSETNDDQKVTAGLGAPQVVTQMDVLNTVGPNLTPRSDTFTIRAYGESLDNAGNTIGRAWVEVVVQRGTQMMIPSERGPAFGELNRRRHFYRGGGVTGNGAAATITPLLEQPVVDPYESSFTGAPGAAVARLPNGSTANEQANLTVNRILGRRFKAISTRWLSANEI
jgi:hypothetical protein